MKKPINPNSIDQACIKKIIPDVSEGKLSLFEPTTQQQTVQPVIHKQYNTQQCKLKNLNFVLFYKLKSIKYHVISYIT